MAQILTWWRPQLLAGIASGAPVVDWTSPWIRAHRACYLLVQPAAVLLFVQVFIPAAASKSTDPVNLWVCRVWLFAGLPYYVALNVLVSGVGLFLSRQLCFRIGLLWPRPAREDLSEEARYLYRSFAHFCIGATGFVTTLAPLSIVVFGSALSPPGTEFSQKTHAIAAEFLGQFVGVYGLASTLTMASFATRRFTAGNTNRTVDVEGLARRGVARLTIVTGLGLVLIPLCASAAFCGVQYLQGLVYRLLLSPKGSPFSEAWSALLAAHQALSTDDAMRFWAALQSYSHIGVLVVVLAIITYPLVGQAGFREALPWIGTYGVRVLLAWATASSLTALLGQHSAFARFVYAFTVFVLTEHLHVWRRLRDYLTSIVKPPQQGGSV